MSSALPVEPLSGKLPSRELLLAEVEAAEDRAAGIREVAARYGVYHGTVRRHLRGVQGQGAANVAQSEAPRVAKVLNSLPDDHRSEEHTSELHSLTLPAALPISWNSSPTSPRRAGTGRSQCGSE